MNLTVWAIIAGTLVMIPLLLCSFISVAVIIERAWRLRRAALIDPTIVDELQTSIQRGQLDQVLPRHRSSNVLVGKVLCRGLEEHLHTSADIETSLTEAGERGLQVLSNNLSTLQVIARIAPLLGLLGTVVGMIIGFLQFQYFSDMSMQERTQQLAYSVGVSLITTAAGLAIAIPTIVAAAYFRARIRRFIAEFEEIFLDIIKTVKTSAAQNSESTEPEAAVSGSAS